MDESNEITYIPSEDDVLSDNSLKLKGQCAIKDFWNHLCDSVPGTPPPLLSNLKVDGQNMNDPQSIANGINTWFTSVIEKYASHNENGSTSCLGRLKKFVSTRKPPVEYIGLVDIIT